MAPSDAFSNVKIHKCLSRCNFQSCAILLILCGFVISSVNASLMNENDDGAVLNRKLHRNELISKLFAKYRQSTLLKRSLGSLEENVLKRLKREAEKREATYNRQSEASYYVSEIFWNYGDEDGISLEDFDAVLAHIGLKKMTRFANESTHDHDHSHHHDHDHEGHDHDHKGHDHDHEGHDHDHEGHDHDHEGHDHDHEGHDHDHDGHDHGDHDHTHDRRRKRQTTHSHAGHNHNHNGTDEEEEHAECMTSADLLYDYGLELQTTLSREDFLYLCPALIYQLDMGTCRSDGSDKHGKEQHGDEEGGGVDGLVWLYTMLCVLVISLCALFGILCIPRKGGNENIVMQFLIALAMASMSGDGMLHLIPHSMVPHHDHGEDDHHGDEEEGAGHLDSLYKGLVVLIGCYAFFFLERVFAIMKTHRDAKKRRSTGASIPMVKGGTNDLDDIDHDHGHSHGGMFNCTSLATMIIVGDMFHNFCDGLAIGAAFAGSLSLGLSTAIAVFCHELPHEIGDFAVLITSGMNYKRAIAFNMLSTVPCFFGAAIGLELGSLGDLSLWIFAFVGGLFLYISLVDLVPEMTRAYAKEGSPWGRFLIVHSIGMTLGVVIMLVLGIYEEDLQQILT